LAGTKNICEEYCILDFILKPELNLSLQNISVRKVLKWFFGSFLEAIANVSKKEIL